MFAQAQKATMLPLDERREKQNRSRPASGHGNAQEWPSGVEAGAGQALGRDGRSGFSHRRALCRHKQAPGPPVTTTGARG